MCEVVQAVLRASEKAANLARACRRQPRLADLLVQEKKTTEANPRFQADFKTLADVLIQETVRRDLAESFPELRDHIYGEESNQFSNSLGDSVTVKVEGSEKETAELLCRVLDGDREAADLLAGEVHKDVTIDEVNAQISGCLHLEINARDLAVWIDPIDSTAEYISGEIESQTIGNISLSGLQCVTVLIGVYDRQTGQPIIGVVNQPFYDGSKGRCVWGICYQGKKIFCNPVKENILNSDVEPTPTICISSSESDDVKKRLINSGYKLVESAGAGYKLLMVILGHADAYILSKPTTYKWDTCGPHAILNSLRGAIIDFSKMLDDTDENDNIEIRYNLSEDETVEDAVTKCNQGGIIAYRNTEAAEKILDILTSNDSVF